MNKEDLQKAYEVKLEEMIKVSKVAPNGSHKIVSDKVGISDVTSRKARNGNGMKTYDKDRMKTLTIMVNEYRKINRRMIEQLEPFS